MDADNQLDIKEGQGLAGVPGCTDGPRLRPLGPLLRTAVLFPDWALATGDRLGSLTLVQRHWGRCPGKGE